MKTLQKILISAFAFSALLGGSALAKTTPVAQEPQMQQAQVSMEKAPMAVGDKVNINTATAAEIQKALVGIGAKKAEAIVQYREKHGNFTAAEQLLEVQGIGKATLEKNKARIAF